MDKKLDVMVIGAGPAGLAAAIQARKRGLDTLLVEKGCLVNSIYNYPENMTFFTTAELLEIGDVPFVVHAEKPKRVDALKYYRRCVQEYGIPFRDFERVISVRGEDFDFTVQTRNRIDEVSEYRTKKIVVATGYFDNPNLLDIPGEKLSKVSHYYTDPHPYYRKKVAVIGGKNSAAIAALELYRNGAEVTLIHRGTQIGRHVKYWILPDIENRIKNGEVTAYFNSQVKEISQHQIVIDTPKGEKVLENDFVFALTGYHPDSSFLVRMGIEVDPESYVPAHDPSTLETNVKGIYLAGSIISGKETNRIFIENGRFHGEQILAHLEPSLKQGRES
ncbi:MAG: YpdA family putative bacillithiol disulfide reductase [Acidobacteriota bacterium]|nr:MAG: YpdA family putative bacillithiol disulfide reductase [Acidobacteriota bacterium]